MIETKIETKMGTKIGIDEEKGSKIEHRYSPASKSSR